MFLYNIHTPQKTFSLQHKDDESYSSLISRIASKAGLGEKDTKALQEKKDGSKLVYEFEGEKWSLEDDDDLSILFSRFPPSETPSATLHLNPPHAHAHFAPTPAPPSYSTASSNIKSKTQKSKGTQPPVSLGAVAGSPWSPSKSQTTSNTLANASTTNGANGTKSTTDSPSKSHSQSNGGGHSHSSAHHIKAADAHHFPTASHASQKLDEKNLQEVGKTADGLTVAKARSIMSTRSRKSKWGNDDAEPLGDVLKRQWLEFHANNGVRTVMGKVGDVDNVRMLLKSGYKQVYISRSFAKKAGLVKGKYSMGAAGYAGLKSLGNVSITVGSHTAQHTALINEEQHFDVVLGRSWMERMNVNESETYVRVDPLDQTALTYMDSGEAIPCDLVVLKDEHGNVITVT